jgi:hypothetical protein
LNSEGILKKEQALCDTVNSSNTEESGIISLCWGYTMIKRKKKKHSVTETQEFKELAKELRKQVPDKKKRLQEMLDEIIDEKTDKTE